MKRRRPRGGGAAAKGTSLGVSAEGGQDAVVSAVGSVVRRRKRNRRGGFP
jgi:hypothetical protein